MVHMAAGLAAHIVPFHSNAYTVASAPLPSLTLVNTKFEMRRLEKVVGDFWYKNADVSRDVNDGGRKFCRLHMYNSSTDAVFPLLSPPLASPSPPFLFILPIQ